MVLTKGIPCIHQFMLILIEKMGQTELIKTLRTESGNMAGTIAGTDTNQG